MDLDTIAAYLGGLAVQADLAWSKGRRPSGAALYSSNEPGTPAMAPAMMIASDYYIISVIYRLCRRFPFPQTGNRRKSHEYTMHNV